MKAKAYLVVQGKRSGRRINGVWDGSAIGAISIVSVKQNAPSLAECQEAVEIEIDLPDDYFDTIHPKIEVIVPPTPAASRVVQTTAQVRAGRRPSAAAQVIHP